MFITLFPFSSGATKEPVIADPMVDGGIPVDDNCAFLILMSDGLYQSLTDATHTDQINVDIAMMVATEFSMQTTLNGTFWAVQSVGFSFLAARMSQNNLVRSLEDSYLFIQQSSYFSSGVEPSVVEN